ncbi:Mss4-like protein [Lasiosphaeria hispida]|uniref:Mss4-like protein n=1 Tax=Lasiosphaeria hispida TaxID=260671 RepID=A0AAJ0MB86_9PEZI|nr:Mss4-like protein [Lasiosphaeria hispida]
MADATQPLKTYRGNCHCGAFVYEVELPEIKAVSACNCSICTKKGYLWVKPSEIKVVKGDEDALTGYTFGSKTFYHKFCPTCATPLLARGAGMLVVNARSIQGFNPWEMEIGAFNGEALGSPYEPPKHIGPEPTADVENAKIYHGGCHCGAVTLALKSAPLDKNFPSRIVECLCSICVRNGYTWIYPPAEAVVIQGGENFGRYRMGQHAFEKTFCKVCGVNFGNEAAAISEEKLAALSPHTRAYHEMAKTLGTMNLKVLNGVDFAEVKEAKREVDQVNAEPKYVNP